MRLKGHKLTMTWCGEYGVESSSTGTCPCGWSESGSSQLVVRFEYQQHLKRVKEEIDGLQGKTSDAPQP